MPGARGSRLALERTLAHEAAFTTSEVHRPLTFRRRRAAIDDWEVVRRAAFREELPSMSGRRGLEDDVVGPVLLGELRHAARWQGLELIAADTGPGTGGISALLADGGGDVDLAAQ